MTAPQPSPPVALGDVPVLVVDDNATNRSILERMLAHWGMKPTLAVGGREALRLLERSSISGPTFALILLDQQMPEMDGFELAARIKQHPRLTHAMVMMLTSGGQQGDAARCRELGVAAYLTKPIRQSELRDALLRVLTTQHEAGRPAGLTTRHPWRERRPPRMSLRILLAEDNVINQALARRMLEKRGHRVVVASNGREALAMLEKESFDLVLMDVQMPETDGLEATAAIRRSEKPAGPHLPVVAMTAHAMKGDRERCLAAGMDDYIAKPIEADLLFQTIESLAVARADETAPVEQPLPD